ncbi:acyl-CoA dehydrogenase family protein, partial [Salmonella enterica]
MAISKFSYSSIPPEAEALRPEVRAFIHDTLADYPPTLSARSWMGFDAEFSKKLCARGWVGMALPNAYGGAQASPFARYV